MVIKWIPRNEVLAAELACALAAKALKIQVPAGFLVLAERDQLPGIPNRVRGSSSDNVLCFGSELQWPDDTSARPKQVEAAADWVWQKICDTPQGPAGGVWDELLANDDRHHENVVFDGHRWWLIDHEYALSTVSKVMRQFAETVARQRVIDQYSDVNVLAVEVLRRRPHDHKMETLPSGWNGLRTRLRWVVDQSQRWDGATGLLPVDNALFMAHIYLKGIDLRLPALALHLSRRLARPQADSLWNSSNKSTSAKKTNGP